MSLLLATGILAVGGLGLFMYKNGSDNKSDSDEGMFDLRSYFGNSNDEDVNEDDNEYEAQEVYETPKRSRGSKTKSARKSSGTKRRY